MEHEGADPTALIDPAFEGRFDAALAAIEAREAERSASRAMWHAHHWPEEYDRCVRVAGRPVCRRCLALYPTSIAVAVAGVAGVAFWPASLDLWFIWLLCVPATLDFVFEQAGVWRYSSHRQLITTLVLAPALGRGMAHELDDRWSWEFWGPVLVFCTIWFFAALEGRRRRNR